MSEQNHLEARTVGEIIAKLDGKKPLRYEETLRWKKFYTASPNRREINKMITNFARGSRGYKCLFGGHAGNGKSTELSRFTNADKIRQRYQIVIFDVSEQLNPDDLEIVELILVVFLEVYAFAEQQKIDIHKSILDRYQKIEGFFQETLKIESLTTKSISIGGEKKFNNLFARIKAEYDTRKIVRETYRPRLNELIQLLNDLCLQLTAGNETQTPLLVIDGLDRVSVEKAQKLFVTDGHNFSLIHNASMLLTIPISLIHSAYSSTIKNTIGPIVVFKNLKLRTRDGQQSEETVANRETLKEFIFRRISRGLITNDALEMAIDYSGGVYRTLMDLVSEAATNAETDGEATISHKEMTEAITDFRIEKSRPMRAEDWAVLSQIKKNKNFLTSTEDETRRTLLQGLFALEYINGDEWYDINPLLEHGLKRFEEARALAEKDDKLVG